MNHCCADLPPWTLRALLRSGDVRLQAVAGCPRRIPCEGLMVKELEPVCDPCFRHRVNGDLANLGKPLGLSGQASSCLGKIACIVSKCLFRIGPIMAIPGMDYEVLGDRLDIVTFNLDVAGEALHPQGAT